MDTSALIAGIVSSMGAARAVLQLAELGLIELFVSRQVIVEADRTIEAKFPEMIDEYRAFMSALSPVLLDDPAEKDVRKFSRLIDPNDAPILAAATLSKTDYLVTWDKKHFISQKTKFGTTPKIATPGEFLQDFRRYIEEK